MEPMNRATLLALHETMCDAAREIMRAKNHDYSGGKDTTNPFLNFTRVERMGVTDTHTGFLVRIVDKLSRLVTHSKNKHFEVNESLEDTVLDVINYMILYFAYTADQTNKDNPNYEFGHDTGDEDD
jgi:hypothetical protein